ncbi:MAG: cytidine deaminase [Acutalibacteraceae bacterium]
MNEAELIKAAKKAAEFAYAPYSGYTVGAALLSKSGKIYTGCNIENAAYSPTNCAERTAFFKAISDGEKDFCAIAVVGGYKLQFKDYFFPCGLCRQVMREFCTDDFQIILGKDDDEFKTMSLLDLLPHSFSANNIINHEVSVNEILR